MAVSFDEEGLPHCSRCGQYLGSGASSGRCSNCHHWYTLSYVRVAPGRSRLLSLLAAAPKKVKIDNEYWRFGAVMFLLGLNVAILLVISILAWRAFMRDLGVNSWI
jgi:hypothetical protein